MKVKRCSKCRKEFLATIEFFYRRSVSKDGLGYWCKECCKKYYQSEKGKEIHKKYKQSEKYKEYQKKYKQSKSGKLSNKKRYRQNKLSCCISTMIRRSLKENKNGRHWENLVPYTLLELQLHLQRTIGLTTKIILNELWQGFYGQFYHLDHIRPITSFEKLQNSASKDFQECWSLNNLKLLDPIKNRKKGDKYDNEKNHFTVR